MASAAPTRPASSRPAWTCRSSSAAAWFLAYGSCWRYTSAFCPCSHLYLGLKCVDGAPATNPAGNQGFTLDVLQMPRFAALSLVLTQPVREQLLLRLHRLLCTTEPLQLLNSVSEHPCLAHQRRC